MGKRPICSGGKCKIVKNAVLWTKKVQISSYFTHLCIIYPSMWSDEIIKCLYKKSWKKLVFRFFSFTMGSIVNEIFWQPTFLGILGFNIVFFQVDHLEGYFMHRWIEYELIWTYFLSAKQPFFKFDVSLHYK